MKHIYTIVNTGTMIAYSLLFLSYTFYRSLTIPGIIDRIYIATFLILCWKTALKCIARKRNITQIIGISISMLPLFLVMYLWALLIHGPTYKLNGLISCITFAYQYTGSTIDWAIPVASILAIVIIILLKFLLKQGWLLSLFCSLTVIYGVGLYLIMVAYYHLPLDHTIVDVKKQKQVTHYQFNRLLQTSRKLLIDSNETQLCAGFVSTSPYLSNAEKSGILVFDLVNMNEKRFFNIRITESFVFGEKSPYMYVAIDEGHIVMEIKKHTQQITRYWPIHSADGLALLDNQHLLVRLESPLQQEPDFIIINIHYLAKKHIFQTITCNSNIIARLNTRSIIVHEHKRIALLTIGNDITEFHLFNYQGNLIKMLTLPDFCWEIYYSKRYQLFIVPSVTSNNLYLIDAKELNIQHFPIPNGVREVAETRDGLIVLSDNLRGKIYIYNMKAKAIVHTFLVGRKPEGIAIGPKTGKLYVISDFGLSIFDMSFLSRKSGRK